MDTGRTSHDAADQSRSTRSLWMFVDAYRAPFPAATHISRVGFACPVGHIDGGSAAWIGDILTWPTRWVPVSVAKWWPIRKADHHASCVSSRVPGSSCRSRPCWQISQTDRPRARHPSRHLVELGAPGRHRQRPPARDHVVRICGAARGAASCLRTRRRADDRSASGEVSR